MINSIFLFFIILTGLDLEAYFSKINHGTFSSNVIKINPNPICTAMGESCASYIPDSSALDINPASLINIKKSSLFISHSLFFEDISMSSIFFAKNLSKNIGSFGFGIKRLNWGSIEKTDEFATPLGNYSPYEMVIEAGFASYLAGLTKEKNQRVVFGGTGKLIINKIEKSATTLSSDIGFIFPHLFENKLIVSFTLQNILGNMKFDKESFSIPKTIKLGSTILISKEFTLNFDIITSQDSIPYISSGFEWNIKLKRQNHLYIRAGLTSKNINDLENFSPFSFGLGFKYWGLSFNYSISNMGYFGNVNKISLTFNY